MTKLPPAKVTSKYQNGNNVIQKCSLNQQDAVDEWSHSNTRHTGIDAQVPCRRTWFAKLLYSQKQPSLRNKELCNYTDKARSGEVITPADITRLRNLFVWSTDGVWMYENRLTFIISVLFCNQADHKMVWVMTKNKYRFYTCFLFYRTSRGTARCGITDVSGGIDQIRTWQNLTCQQKGHL